MSKYYFIKAKNLRHIARKSKPWTLCDRFYNDSGNPTYEAKVTGREKYKKGRDCKTCFRKAKLKILEVK